MPTIQQETPSATSIVKLAEDQLENYSRQPEELISHYNRERSAIDGYRGRQLLELLQNADDAGAGFDDGCVLRLDITRDRLVVANTGTPFSLNGLKSLVISDCSPKQLDRNRFIGNKGLGFRSILSWTDSPMISSGSFKVSFDRSRAIEAVKQLADSSPYVHEAITPFFNASGVWPAAVMRFPTLPDTDHRWLAESLKWRAEFETVVVIPISPEADGDAVHKEILKQLSSIESSSLLFCRHLTRVDISGDYERKWQLLREDKKRPSQSPVILQCDDRPDELWYVTRREGQVSETAAVSSKHQSRDFEIAVAIPDRVLPNRNGTLCVFFPTHESLPCPLLMHATVDTTDDRNHLVENDSNTEVLSQLAKLVASTLEDHVSNTGSRDALLLLAGVERLSGTLNRLGFLSTLVGSCLEKRLFPRIDGEMTTADECRLAPHDVWIDELGEIPFPEILSIGGDASAQGFVELCKLKWYSPVTLRDRIKAYLHTLPRDRAGEVVGKLMASQQLSQINARGMLIDDTGHCFDDGVYFFTPTERLPTLPEWVAGIRFVDPAFQIGLAHGAMLSGVRQLIAELTRCNCNIDEYRFETVARALIEEIGSAVEDSPETTSDKWRSLLRWIFHASTSARALLPSLPIKLLTTKGKLQRATSCYLSSAYPKGALVWRLYNGFERDEFVGPPEQCGLGEISATEAERFLLTIGVHYTPKLEPLREPTKLNQLANYVIDRLEYPRHVRECHVKSAKDLRLKFWRYSIDGLRVPDRWFELLVLSDREALVAYLLTSGSHLLQSETDIAGVFGARTGNELKDRKDSSIQIPNPVLFWLRETSWVPVADEPDRRPSEIMLSRQGAKVLQGVYARHSINTSDSAIASAGGQQAVDGLLTRLGSASSLESLSGESLYDMLIRLPKRDPEGKLAARIYRTLVESNIAPELSTYQDEFLRSGQMWGRHNGIEGYFQVEKLRYNASLSITKAIESHIPLVAIPRGKNTVQIKQLFGITSLSSSEISVQLLSGDTEFSSGSEDANLHFRSALPFIYALRLARNIDDAGKELNLLKNSALRVCTRIKVAATLPGGKREEIALTSADERIVVGTTLHIVGDFDPETNGTLTFWLNVAELVAELFGRDIADEVGGVLRCGTTSEMREVIQVRLGHDSDAKLSEALRRFSDTGLDSDDPKPRPRIIPKATTSEAKPQDTTSDESSQDDTGDSVQDNLPITDIPVTGPESNSKITFEPISGPTGAKPKKRKLVITRPVGIGGGNGGRGPIATEDVTFKVTEDFEQSEGRFTIRVSHLHGSDAFGCDLISVESAVIRDAALASNTIDEAKIVRFIEVKGRSVRSGDVELSENELRAAKVHKSRYWLYRVFVDPSPSVASSSYEIALLRDPANSKALRTVPRFNLSQGSGAEWFAMTEVFVDEEGVKSDDAQN